MAFITTADGTEIFYKDWGSGRPVVFSHGWPLNADAWDDQLRAVADNGFRAIAHDRRGHGRSTQTWTGNDMDTYADDLAQLIETLDLREVVLVGHSTGGGEVTRYIGRHGTSRVAKAVLLGAVPPLMLKTEHHARQIERGPRDLQPPRVFLLPCHDERSVQRLEQRVPGRPGIDLGQDPRRVEQQPDPAFPAEHDAEQPAQPHGLRVERRYAQVLSDPRLTRITEEESRQLCETFSVPAPGAPLFQAVGSPRACRPSCRFRISRPGSGCGRGCHRAAASPGGAHERGVRQVARRTRLGSDMSKRRREGIRSSSATPFPLRRIRHDPYAAASPRRRSSTPATRAGQTSSSGPARTASTPGTAASPATTPQPKPIRHCRCGRSRRGSPRRSRSRSGPCRTSTATTAASRSPSRRLPSSTS
ncbi:alpha/beta hydrolase [Nonomuraea sp. NPDC049152]|uniref:alpha/beta hydrolase n=1 Tax=Nonomuraea sp. NPDC049152 TaxID=3154350 RepID=UPI0033F600FD